MVLSIIFRLSQTLKFSLLEPEARRCLDDIMPSVVRDLEEEIEKSGDRLTLGSLESFVARTVHSKVCENLKPLVTIECDAAPDGVIEVSISASEKIHVTSSAFH